jgi:hypothetical protein
MPSSSVTATATQSDPWGIVQQQYGFLVYGDDMVFVGSTPPATAEIAAAFDRVSLPLHGATFWGNTMWKASEELD